MRADLDERPRPCSSDIATLGGRLTPDLLFDAVEGGDAFDGFAGDGRSVRHMKVVKLLEYVRPARCFPDLAVAIKMMEPSVTVGLQDAAEAAQVRSGMFASRSEEKQNGTAGGVSLPVGR